METSGFWKAPCGRILVATVAWTLIGAGFIIAARTTSLVAIALVCLVAVVGGTFAAGLAIDRFPLKALALAFILPVAGVLYFAGLMSLGGRPIGGGLLLTVGLVLAWTAVHRRAAPRMVPIPAGAGRPVMPTPSSP